MTARSLPPLAARLSAALAVGTLALLASAAPSHADFNFTDVTTPALADTPNFIAFDRRSPLATTAVGSSP